MPGRWWKTLVVAVCGTALAWGTPTDATLEGDFIGNVRVMPGVQLLELGDFHSTEVEPPVRGGWMGLVKSGESFALRGVQPRSKRVHDEVVDESNAAGRSGLRIWVDGAEPLLLVHGLRLSGGPVTAVAQNEELLHSGAARVMTLGGHRYELTLINPEASTDAPDVPGPHSSVVLSSDGKRQTLAYFVKGGDSVSLLWAGDLDGDGRLDFFLDVSGHENVSTHVLFLSGQAVQGELVRPVAKLTLTGC